jgi:hypothetical protein
VGARRYCRPSSGRGGGHVRKGVEAKNGWRRATLIARTGRLGQAPGRSLGIGVNCPGQFVTPVALVLAERIARMNSDSKTDFRSANFLNVAISSSVIRTESCELLRIVDCLHDIPNI